MEVGKSTGGFDSPENPSLGGERLALRENKRLESWRNAYPEHKPYSAGETHGYKYPEGEVLEIEGEQVMSTCEAPWASATVDMARQELTGLKPEYDLKVLDVGFGLGLTADRMLDLIRQRGHGTLHSVELNSEVAKDARRWARNRMDRIKNDSNRGLNPEAIDIKVHEGDAGDVLQRLILDEGKKFNIIISDTYPVEGDYGMNDLKYLDVVTKGLYPGGVFAFFAYYPGWENDPNKKGTINAEQLAEVAQHFRHFKTSDVPVYPAPEYKYLWSANGEPVRKLPVVVCSNPHEGQ